MKYTAASLVAIVGYASAAMEAYAPPANTPATYPTSPCPAPGVSDSQGRYSCNPAHQYPEGQTCEIIDGCYFLRHETPGVSAPAPSASYACNPAHQYPNGAQCISTTGTLVLATPPATPTAVYPTGTSPAAQPTASCPAPGTSDSQGRYSCNPAHQYPAGQICDLIDGCYFLRIPGPGVSAPPPGTSTSSTPVSPTSACPPPGTTDSKGRYSCNPAHQYPAGQTCQMIDGCPYLSGPSGSASPTGYIPTTTGRTNVTSPSIVPYAGAGSKAFATGAPLAALVLGVLFL